MSKPVILTGLRANNDLHLGNYLGALLPIVQMQKQYAGEYQINLFVPDLHSFTTPIDHTKLQAQIMHNLKLFVAAGLDLDDPNTFIYRQSFLPAHSELTVILNSFTYMGELKRMTQFKDKSEGQDNVSAGLFDYPVLMAADILLYGAKYVPVGADQTQHVELARDIAIRMNNKFDMELFKLPEAEKAQIAFASKGERLRVRDLIKPDKKMSKSEESGKGVIFLGDTPEVAAKKVMGATTDSVGVINYDMTNQPGISNLIEILAALGDKPIDEVAKDYQDQTQYGALKQDVANAVQTFLQNFQNKLAEVDEAKLLQKLEASEKAMNEVAGVTLRRVQKAVGLR
ncbi:MAG: tryptophan--tRNA ligase [Candidatus Saccharimonadales bacterium]